jgi:hypothetical protein
VGTWGNANFSCIITGSDVWNVKRQNPALFDMVNYSTHISKKSQMTHPINAYILPSNPLRSLARQKPYHRSNVVRFSQPSTGVLLRNRVDDVLRLSLAEQRRVNGTRGNRVNGDAASPKIFCQNPGNLLDGTFGCEVAKSIGSDRCE